MPFQSLGLRPALHNAATALGLQAPTPVQSAAIPPMLAGRDLLVQARTGSGKTLAYALPLLQAWLLGKPRSPRPIEGLVVVPTRELALQVGESLRELAGHLPGLVKINLGFGGVSINPQLMALRGGADILVATPGRLLDLVRHNAVHLDSVRTLVLDEADRLLDLGFAEELAELQALLPPQRQTVLCSATWPREVQALSDAWLHAPQEIRLASLAAARPDIRQRSIRVDTGRRTALLRHLLDQQREDPTLRQGDARALVFVASQHGAEHVASKLRQHGLKAETFHGGLSQGARTSTLDAFKDGEIRVLLATDMAARGLHIEALPLVVNYDLPRAPEEYIHRIGRTGRAGGQGDAISFVTTETEAHFRLIEKRQGQRVPREVLPGFEPTDTAPTAPAPEGAPASGGAGTGLDPNGGVKGRRPSKKDKLRQAAAQVSNPAASPAPEAPGKNPKR